VLAVQAPGAHAEISAAQTIDGPGPNILELDGVAMADDGSGALVYRKRVSGRAHVFVSLLMGGATWSAPQQVDKGQPFDSAWPQIGVGAGGRAVVTWTQPFAPQADRMWSATLDPGSRIFQNPLPVDLDVGQATATYPSLAMSRGGVAYLAYRVLDGPNPDPTLPPGFVYDETRVARYDGQFWSVLGQVANRNPSSPVAVPAVQNSARVGVDATGNAIVGFQEPDDSFVNRIYARRVFGLNLGIPLLVSPQTYGGQPLRGGADAPSVSSTGFGIGAIAFRQSPGPQSALRGTRIMLATIPDQFSLQGSTFGDARLADGAGTAGPTTAPGPPSVSIAPKGALSDLFGLGDAAVQVPGTLNAERASERVDDGSSTVPPRPMVTQADSGAQALAYEVGGPFSGVVVRERDASGIADTKPVSAAQGGPVNQLELGGSGLGDAAVAFEQGGQRFGQIAAAVVDAPPETFAVQAPQDTVRSGAVPITWSPAPNAIGAVIYSITVDDEVVADSLTGLSRPLTPDDIGDGTHQIALIATDQAGQSATSKTVTVRVDRNAPTVTVRRLRGGRVRVSVSDGDGSGVASSSIVWGDGTKGHGARASHTYHRHGRVRIVVRVRDRAGNHATVRRSVRV